MNNGALLWGAAMVLASFLVIAVATEYSLILAIILWFVLTLILLLVRPQ
jgi:hypothetical protein